MRELLVFVISLVAIVHGGLLQKRFESAVHSGLSQQKEKSLALGPGRPLETLSAIFLSYSPSLLPLPKLAIMSHEQRASQKNMGGGVLQARPGNFIPDGLVPMIKQLDLHKSKRHDLLPKLIVFDLDNTLWTPELYTLRAQPKAGKDVWLLDGASAVLWELATSKEWKGVKVAVASRTSKMKWAQRLLSDFDVPGVPGMKLSDMLVQAEIYPKNKDAHFRQLSDDLLIAYDDMLFFDDSKDGKYGNCVPVSQMGVLSAHCPEGLNARVWRHALSTFAKLAKTNEPKGRVLGMEYPSYSAKVVTILEKKGFGFVHLDKGNRNSDIFFHKSVVPHGVDFHDLVGQRVEVKISTDKSGRTKVAKMAMLDKAAASTKSDVSTISLPCFSMGMPFAALLAHGYKTEESRNNRMFEGTLGKTVLLHVGHKTFDDGGKHLEILRDDGLNEKMIERMTSLPDGFFRGGAVAVMELGDTRLTTLKERSTPDMEKSICAYGQDSGKYVTEIRKVSWLKEPVKIRGQPGIFSAIIPKTALPDGFDVADD